MKKRLLSVALAVVMVVCLVGCGNTYQKSNWNTSAEKQESICGEYFAVITHWGGS